MNSLYCCCCSVRIEADTESNFEDHMVQVALTASAAAVGTIVHLKEVNVS